jgi:hypothetical protein
MAAFSLSDYLLDSVRWQTALATKTFVTGVAAKSAEQSLGRAKPMTPVV